MMRQLPLRQMIFVLLVPLEKYVLFVTDGDYYYVMLRKMVVWIMMMEWMMKNSRW